MVEIHEGKKRRVTAIFKDANGAVVEAPDAVNFSIAHTAVAEFAAISAISGFVTAVADGDTELSAASAGITHAEPVQVVANPLGPAVTMEFEFGDEEDA